MNKIDYFDGEYAFLSNFYDSPIEKDGILYPTVEHYFQAMKTLHPEERKEIAAAATPGKAKRLGRNVQLRFNWEQVKYQVMYDAVYKKFSREDLKASLLSTGDAELIEGNTWHDNIWGQCSCEKCKNIKGTNWLGKILMIVREELRHEKET